MWVSIIISGITALAAILAPLATAWLNNKHDLKIKEQEFLYNQKVNIYKDFHAAFGKYSGWPNAHSCQDFWERATQVLSVCNEEIRNVILNILQQPKNWDKVLPNLQQAYNQVTVLIAEDIANSLPILSKSNKVKNHNRKKNTSGHNNDK